MTDEPSLEPTPPPKTPSSEGRRPRLGLWISWTVIVGLTLLIAALAARASERGYGETINAGRARMAAFLAIQLKTLAAASPSTLSDAYMGNADRLVDDLARDADSDADRIRVAILKGELHGPRAALDALHHVSGKQPSLGVLHTIYEGGVPTSSEKDLLISELGDLGRIAWTHSAAPHEDDRRRIESEALWFSLRVSALGIGALLLVAGALAAFAAACVFAFRNQLQIGRAHV